MVMAPSGFCPSSFSSMSSYSRIDDNLCLNNRASSSMRSVDSLKGGDIVCVLDGIVFPVHSRLKISVHRSMRRSPVLKLSSQTSEGCVECSNHGVTVREFEQYISASTSKDQFSQAVERSIAANGRRCFSDTERWSRRREVLLAMGMASLVTSPIDARAEDTLSVDVPSLEPYSDEKEGFKLLRPALWNKVEKAGATVLFEDPATRGNTIGVVVNPVRISSLKDFGGPDVVADKLIAAERRKPSTNDVQLVRVQERQAHGNTPLYELEYTLDSSRGKKRLLSAVTVASRKLYILSISYTDSPTSPAPPAVAEVFQQVLDSFDLLL